MEREAILNENPMYNIQGSGAFNVTNREAKAALPKLKKLSFRDLIHKTHTICGNSNMPMLVRYVAQRRDFPYKEISHFDKLTRYFIDKMSLDTYLAKSTTIAAFDSIYTLRSYPISKLYLEPVTLVSTKQSN